MNYLVCGPPGSGKTTFVKKRAHWGDLIVDLDAIFVAISGLDEYEKPSGLMPVALAVRDLLIERAADGGDFANAWIIAGAPTAAERGRLAKILRAKVYVLEVPSMICARRIGKDARRASKLQQWLPIIEKWWRNYQKLEIDNVIK